MSDVITQCLPVRECVLLTLEAVDHREVFLGVNLRLSELLSFFLLHTQTQTVRRRQRVQTGCNNKIACKTIKCALEVPFTVSPYQACATQDALVKCSIRGKPEVVVR